MLNKNEAGIFLCNSFIKRSSSFHSGLGKIAITASMTQIHQSRVDLKKVFALLSLFDLLNAKEFKYKEAAGIFRKIYKLSGEIREYQVNICYLEGLKEDHPGLENLIQYFDKNRKKSIRTLISEVSGFNKKKFNRVRKEIRQWLSGIDDEIIVGTAVLFLNQRSVMMEKLADKQEGEETIHQIRKELKKIIAIYTLLDQISPVEERQKMFRELGRFESEIGVWHDKIILLDHTRKFIHSQKSTIDSSIHDLELFCLTLESEARLDAEQFFGMTRVASNLVRYSLKPQNI